MAPPIVLDIQTTENDINNTSAEVDLFSFSVAGGTLGSTHALRCQIRADYLNNSAATKTFILRIKYGSTILWADTTGVFPVDAARRPITIDFILFARNSTNSQGLAGNILIGTAGLATTGVGDLGTDELNPGGDAPLVGVNGSEDSTTNLDLKVTAQHSAALSTVSIRRLYSSIERL